MNINQIRTFLMVVEVNSFSEASYRLYISQSNVSKHIQALEKEFDFALFLRKNRTIELTEFGQLFFRRAKTIYDMYLSLEQDINNLKHHHLNNIKIVSIPILTNPHFTKLIDTFNSEYTDINLSLEEDNPAQVVSAIKSSRFDFAIVRDFYQDIESLFSLPILDEEMVAVLPANHKLSGKNRISLSSLKYEDFILLNHDTRLSKFVIDACLANGFNPKANYTLKRISNVIEFVEQGKGVSLVFSKFLEKSIYKNRQIHIAKLDPSITNTILLVRNPDNKLTPEMKLFEEFISGEYKSL